MAFEPKPVSLTQVDAGDYDGTFTPEPLVVVGDIPGAENKTAIAALTALGTSGTSTVAQIETAVNAIIAALKA